MKKFLRYSWSVASGLISLIVIIAILSVGGERPEGLLYPILIIIYLSLRNYFIISHEASVELAAGLNGQFKILRKMILREDVDDYEGPEDSDEVKEYKRQVVIQKVFIWISYVVTVIALIGILSL